MATDTGILYQVQVLKGVPSLIAMATTQFSAGLSINVGVMGIVDNQTNYQISLGWLPTPPIYPGPATPGQIAFDANYLYVGGGASTWLRFADSSTLVSNSTQVIAGYGLTGGGALTSNVTISLISPVVAPTVGNGNITVDTYSSTVTFSMLSSNRHELTLAGNPTLAVSNVTIGQVFTIRLIQDGAGNRTVTWFGGITWPGGGNPPTLSTAGGQADVFVFECRASGVYDGFPAFQNLIGNGTITVDTYAATVTFSMATSNRHELTLTGNAILAISNVNAGQVFTLRLIQDGVGGRTVTWFNTISWPGGSPPTLTATPNKADVFVFECRGAGIFDGFTVGLAL
jgi:hypothetical protein